MSVPFGKWSFAAGEISPSLFGHVDFAKFSIGASTMRNMTVNYHGGTYSRAGTAFVGFSKQTGNLFPPRLIGFQFSITQGLALEFGEQYMRVVFNGAFVTETPENISTITRGAATTITSAAHGYSNGDWVFTDGIVGTTQLNGKTFVVAGATTNTFQITDVYGNPINSTAYGVYVSGGTVARIYTLVTPYSAADLPYLKFTQSADVMTLCCWNQSTGTSYSAYDLTREADDNWTLTAVTNTSSITAPAYANVVANVVSPGTTDNAATAYAYVATAVSKTTSEESIASPRADVGNSVDISTTAGSLTINWGAVDGAGYYHIYKAPPAHAPFAGNIGNSAPVPPGALFGYAGTSYGTQFIDTNVIPDFSQVPPLHQDPFAPGQIIDVQIVTGGSGPNTTATWAVTTSTGSGFDGYPVVIGGVLTNFVITNAGANYAPGDSIAFNGAGFASGGVTYAANPTAGDTVTLNGAAIAFVASITGANQVLIQSTLATTMSALATFCSNSSRPALTVASYVALASGLTIQYNTAGAAGNAYTLATSGSGTVSGATLTGGSGIAGTNPSAILIVGPETGTSPSVVSYFQERKVFGATPNNPDTYFMSQPGSFHNFDTRVPTIDTDAITGSPWSIQVNGIQAMVSMPGGLVVFTGRQAWQLTGAGGSSLNPQPITPASQQAQPQAYNGCSATFTPIGIDYDIIYLQAKGSKMRDISYNFFTNIYTGQDITQISSQLFTGYQILEGAWCEEPFRIIWVTRSDGTLLSLTWDKSQELSGWARHDTNGYFASVCAVTEPPVDALYVATNRFPGGQNAYMIERMDNRDWQTAEQCWCVDSGLALTQPVPSGFLLADSADGSGEILGAVLSSQGSGYSPSASATIVDDNGNGPGFGARATPVIDGNGAITRVDIAAPGRNYTFPKLVISDPGGTGSGAEGALTLDTTATFTAQNNVFGAGSVGSVIRMGGGIATITQRISPTTVKAMITSPITDLLPNSGGQVAAQATWTLTAPVTTISGLDHLIGATVTGLADGNVITPRAVDGTGSITLDNPASAVIVGLGFQAQLQSVYLETGSPTAQGQRKKISAVTARIEGSRSLLMGANQPDGSTLSPPQIAPVWNNLDDVPDKAVEPYNGTFQPLYTGDVRIPIGGGFAKPGQVCLQQDLPLPMQILSLVIEILPGDTPQLQEPKRQPQQARR